MLRDRWSRGDKIAFLTLLVTIVGVGVAATQAPWIAARFQRDPAPSLLLPREANADSAAAAQRMSVLLAERRRLTRSLARQYRHRMHTDVVRIALRNDCNTRVSAGIHYLALDGMWTTEGWGDIDPGETLRTRAVTRNAIFYYHADAGAHAGNEGSRRGGLDLRVTNHSFIMVGRDSRDLARVGKLHTLVFAPSTSAEEWGWLVQPICGSGA